VSRVKSGAASPPGGTHQLSGMATLLMSLLAMAYGSNELAVAALTRALVRAGRATVPEPVTDLVVFTRGYLLEILRLDLGPARALALVDDLLARLLEIAAPPPSEPPESVQRPVARITLRPASKPPATRRSVLLVDPDRIRRSTLARALLRVQWDVTVVDTVEQLVDALHGALLDVAIVDLPSPWTTSVVDTLAASCPNLLVIGRGAKEDVGGSRPCSSAALMLKRNHRPGPLPAHRGDPEGLMSIGTQLSLISLRRDHLIEAIEAHADALQIGMARPTRPVNQRAELHSRCAWAYCKRRGFGEPRRRWSRGASRPSCVANFRWAESQFPLVDSALAPSLFPPC
jgi:hypothetical protein